MHRTIASSAIRRALPLLTAMTLSGAGTAEAASCKGPLTGRVVAVPTSIKAFGTIETGAPLPLLRAGEYALTIDDGPNPISTGPFLGILDRECVHATFMEVGDNGRKHPELSRAVIAHGQGLGSHSMDHKPFVGVADPIWQTDMLDGADAVEVAATGKRRGGAWRFFRFPGGAGMPRVALPQWRAFAVAHHLVVAGYDFSGDDWKNGPPATSLKILLGRLGDRGTIVVHEGQPNTLVFLPMLLAELQRRGARIVTLSLAPR